MQNSLSYSVSTTHRLETRPLLRRWKMPPRSMQYFGLAPMTRIPTLEEIVTGSPYELVDSPFSNEKMEAWRAQSIATGASGALAAFHKLYQDVRNDAADAAARADEAEARMTLV